MKYNKIILLFSLVTRHIHFPLRMFQFPQLSPAIRAKKFSILTGLQKNFEAKTFGPKPVPATLPDLVLPITISVWIP